MNKDLEISMLTHTVNSLWQVEITAKVHSAQAADSLIRILQEIKPLLAENDERAAGQRQEGGG